MEYLGKHARPYVQYWYSSQTGISMADVFRTIPELSTSSRYMIVLLIAYYQKLLFVHLVDSHSSFGAWNYLGTLGSVARMAVWVTLGRP